MRVLAFFISLLISSLIYSQSAGADYNYSVRCLGLELDGTMTLESFGKGRNYLDATEQAKKNAVRAVIFEGIRAGSSECTRDPLILSRIAPVKYEEYFAAFFKDNGEYLKFVSMKDEKISNKIKRNVKKSEEFQQRKVVVIIDRLALKRKFQTDNIE
jgi:hypothetical protein